jgi:tRNA dimethylallyltransferase
VIGGTGLYHAHLTTQDPQLTVPPNDSLRQELEAWNVADLQKRLAEIAPQRFNQMNHSDRHNPRRLIRAIEVSEVSPAGKTFVKTLAQQTPVLDLTLGLIDDLETIHQRIHQRVEERLSQGAIAEVEKLIADYEVWRGPAFTATGLREVRALIEGQLEKNECIERWSLHEFQYAKRQLTWWKKYAQATWYEISQSGWQEKVWSSFKESVLDDS